MAAIAAYRTKGCNTTKNNPIMAPAETALTRTLAMVLVSCEPKACEVSPLEPIRRNPNIQQMTLNIMLPTAMAPIYELSPICPTIATSTRPSSGTVMFDTIEGMAMRRISEFMEYITIADKQTDCLLVSYKV